MLRPLPRHARVPVAAIPIALLAFACGGKAADPMKTSDASIASDAQEEPPVSVEQRRVIYQLVVRTFSNTNGARIPDGTIEQNGVGKFDDINGAALDSLAAMGVTDLWLTGVLRQATLTDHSDIGLPADDADVVKGRAGSFFAVRDYFDVSPDYAKDKSKRLDEFDALVARVHEAKMRVFIDFVPNHVARGYKSIVKPELSFGLSDDTSVFFSPSNNFYYLPDQGPLQLSKPAEWNPPGVGFDGLYEGEDASSAAKTPKVTGLAHTSTQPPEYEWYETVKLNYGYNFVEQSSHFDPIPATWVLMDQVLAYWQARGVDGFRCDFAHVIPHDAWRYLIDRARERDANVYFFAEAYASIPDLVALRKTGFDAIYHDDATDALKSIYQGNGSQEGFSDAMAQLDDTERPHFLHYLENHDERRIASPVVVSGDPNATGFGGIDASYQLAPLVYLYGSGPVLVYNGQELGEEGADREGFSGADGRTSIFDYWQAPELAKWVNGHAYDGGLLAPEQQALRAYYADLLALANSELGRSDRYWGLKYFNRPDRFGDCPDGLYSFARYESEGGRLLVVVANFAPNQASSGRLRIPAELASAAALGDELELVLRLDRSGLREEVVTTLSRAQLVTDGFAVEVPNQTALVFALRPAS